jgi:hypothetical protein
LPPANLDGRRTDSGREVLARFDLQLDHRANSRRCRRLSAATLRRPLYFRVLAPVG